MLKLSKLIISVIGFLVTPELVCVILLAILAGVGIHNQQKRQNVCNAQGRVWVNATYGCIDKWGTQK